MQNKTSIKANKLVFSKWSRKSYAVFASLGRVVKIAQLKVDICNQAIKKNINIITEFIQKLNKQLELFADELIEQLESLLLEGLIPQQGEVKASHSLVKNRNKEYNQIRPDSLVGGFLIFTSHGECK